MNQTDNVAGRWDDEDWDDALSGAGEINDAQQVHKRVHTPMLDWMESALLDPNIGDWIPEDVAIGSICVSTQTLNDQYPDHADRWREWSQDEQGDEPGLCVSHDDILKVIRSAFMLGMIFNKDYSEGKVNLG
jgi:hypothetical protein